MFHDGSELEQLGFNPFFFRQISGAVDATRVARVIAEHRGEYELGGVGASRRAVLAGRLQHELSEAERPTVGDWVLVSDAAALTRIEQTLERQNVLRRVIVGGSSRAQNLAANVDLCCVVAALSDGDDRARHRSLNARRIQRYLSLAESSRIPALVLINKADVLDGNAAEQAREALSNELPEARTLLVSAHTGQGIEELRAELPAGSTAVLLGSSGVGKSTLVNALLGAAHLRTGAEREGDARGRHTTTARQLLRLEHGALLIDTPGMRELALWADADTDAPEAFDDIAALAEGCRFRDCAHRGEPGCAVISAVEAGVLSAARLEHAHKLERELLHQKRRVDQRLRSERQRQVKAAVREARVRTKDKWR